MSPGSCPCPPPAAGSAIGQTTTMKTGRIRRMGTWPQSTLLTNSNPTRNVAWRTDQRCGEDQSAVS